MVRFQHEPHRVPSNAEKSALFDAAGRYGEFLGRGAQGAFLDG